MYLLPDWDDDDHLARMIKKHAKTLFENELAAWSQDESTWPKRRDAKTFFEWFDVEAHSMVMDLGDGEIEVEGG